MNFEFLRDVLCTFCITCAAVCGRSEHVVHPVGVEDEGWVGDVVLAGGLRQREALLEHAENGLGHRLGPPRFQGAALAESQIVHEALVRVPALLPHALQLVLVAVCKTNSQKLKIVI